MSLSPGTRLGRYEIRSKLGAGGMAEVYLAEDTELGRRVALKLLPPDTTTDDHARKRLLREARASATLDHPHICAVYDVGEAAGQRFIAMQFIEGETLDVRLKRKPLDLKTTLAVATGVADALAEAHEHGIVHRDIKPSNVMITSRGEAVVLDFGLAKLVQDQHEQGNTATESLLSAPGVVMGTVPYMSPEQVRGEALDGRSDVFSFGVMLYEMLSGQRPFADKNSAATASAILTREPLPLTRFNPELPQELGRIVSKTLRKDPDERYQSAKDLLIDLRTLRDEHEFKQRLERSAPRSVDSDPVVTEAAAPSPSGGAAGPPVRSGSGASRASVVAGAPASRRSRRMLAVAVLAVAVFSAAGWYAWRQRQVRWATAQLPRIEALSEKRQFFEAYDLAVEVERVLPRDPALARWMSTVSTTVTVRTDPPGARVYVKRFVPDATGALPDRELAGTTPLTDMRVARGEYVLSIEKDGYAPTERTVSGVLLRAGNLVIAPPPVLVDQRLIPAQDMPARMVAVPGGDYRLVAWSRPTDRRIRLGDFFIDKYEVTNQEYKEFISAGGYLKREFWRHPFVRDGREVTFEEAMRVFVDRSGLPGPRGWSGQNVPEGKADHPVTDVTWYEAAAYAAFRGRQLPTIFQWEKAARNGAVTGPVSYMPWGMFYPGDTLAHHANFDSNGTVPATSLEFGMSPFGAYNMAGNVAEWTLNDTSEGVLATGGAWGDPTYLFAQYPMLPGFYSSNKLGFRCAITSPGASGDQGAARIEITGEIPSYKASSAADFARWSAPYQYEHTALDARVEDVKETPDWRREKISFVGMNGERGIAYLYLPHHFARPLQVIHFVPAADVNGGFRSLPESIEDRLAPFIKSGRAVFGVVLQGYIERLRPPGYQPPDPRTVEYLEALVSRITDVRRGLDYLTTRTDVDVGRIAFFGPSAGAQLGLILAAVEPRYRAVALMGAGLPAASVALLPEANPVNFAAHIRPPKLMLHGKYDEDTPIRTAAEPLYALLPGPKRLVLYEGGHVAPIDLQFSTMTAWLDEVMGPVRR